MPEGPWKMRLNVRARRLPAYIGATGGSTLPVQQMAQNLDLAFPFVRVEAARKTQARAPQIMQPLFDKSYKSHVTSLLLLANYSCFNRLTLRGLIYLSFYL